jgi:hypothetical protein
VCGSLAGIAGFQPGTWNSVVSVVSKVCCQIEVSATGRFLVQKSSTECDVSECDRGTSYRRPRPITAVQP